LAAGSAPSRPVVGQYQQRRLSLSLSLPDFPFALASLASFYSLACFLIGGLVLVGPLFASAALPRV